MLAYPELTQKVIERKYEYIFRGYHELDFPFPEIIPTFNDIRSAATQQLQELEQQWRVLTAAEKTAPEQQHNTLFRRALEYIKTNFLIVQRLDLLSQGIKIERKRESDQEVERITMKFPYGKCIELCADYVELSDLTYRVLERFEKFGPNVPYFDEAISLSSVSEKLTFHEYLKILENQDYITAFNKILLDPNISAVKLKELCNAKENGYRFLGRSDLLKEIYKAMAIPFPFHADRYKHHLREDLLALDIVLFPTIKKLNIADFANLRSFNFFPLGIIRDIIFADEFYLTAADFFYHDVKHSIDMISRNWVTYLEQGYSLTEASKHFTQVKMALDIAIEAELSSLKLDKERYEEIKKAINLTLFEIHHEEGYPHDYNAIIRALEKPNPFYGETLIGFLKVKLTTLHFFKPSNTTKGILKFSVDLLCDAKKIILRSLYKLKELSKDDNYKLTENGYWEITRGRTQKNPYQILNGENDYETAHKQIGNIFLLFKEEKKIKNEVALEVGNLLISKPY